MTHKEALKMALEALETSQNKQPWAYDQVREAITAVKEALMSQSDGAQQSPQRSEDPNNEQVEPRAYLVYAKGSHRYFTLTFDIEKVPEIYKGGYVEPLYTHPPVPTAQPEKERNFCQRCGKRLGQNDWDIHTCTQPQPKEPEQRNASEHLEPVAFETWYEKFHSFAGKSPLLYSDLHCAWQAAKLYTETPQRKPLTDEQIAEFAERMEASDPTDSFWREFARAIEAAHGIKE